VSDFVEECRREWKRLRVPDPVANEMAADLEADLKEAEAEGASAEAVLGSGAFDPRSFAASWAAERGVIQPPPVAGPRRSRMPAIVVALTLVTVLGAAVLAIAASRSGPSKLALVASPSFRPAFRVFPPAAIPRPPMPRGIVVGNASGFDLHRIGSILLILGIVGLILSVLYWSSSAGRSTWSRRRGHINNGLGGPRY